MIRIIITIGLLLSTIFAEANQEEDKLAIERAARDYIESQHKAKPEMMARGLHKDLKKRTYWGAPEGKERILETDYNTMLRVAKNYNKNGDKFPSKPRADIAILDVEQRVASVKLTADDWIDYMHLYKNEKGQWKIINVLWQYNDITKQFQK